MDDPGAAPFKDLLRRYRLRAGLSQEALAELARLSIRAISDLERGVKRWPRPETVRLLAEALNLALPERARLSAAARRPSSPRIPADRLPPGDTPPSPPTAPAAHLPLQLSSFIGREREQEAVRSLLGAHRLVTIVGPGGAGKTCLALCVADALVPFFAEGVRLVELAALGEPSLAPRAVAAGLGLREEPGQSLSETVAAHLTSSRMLLVLDNCEHLIEACAELVAFLLRRCPQLHVLATSREGLRVPGEPIYQAPSLSLPEAGRLLTPEHLLTFEAIRLFVERARERRPEFSLTAANADAVVRICRQLDGMPLALELAAVRIGVLTADDIAARLDDRFRLLTGGHGPCRRVSRHCVPPSIGATTYLSRESTRYCAVSPSSSAGQRSRRPRHSVPGTSQPMPDPLPAIISLDRRQPIRLFHYLSLLLSWRLARLNR